MRVQIFVAILIWCLCTGLSAQETRVRDFTFSYKAVYHDLTPGAPAQMWVPLPQSNPVQKVSRLRMSPPLKARIVTDDHGNRLLHMKGKVPKHGRLTFKLQTRIQRQVWQVDSLSAPTSLVEALQQPNSAQHLFFERAQAQEISTLSKQGFLLTSKPEGPAEPGLWAIFQCSDQSWAPIDFSSGTFGHLDENRVLMSSGRNLTFKPPQQSGPVQQFIRPLLEVEGQKIQPSEFQVIYSDRSSKPDK